jgi:hypothetical protein
MSVACVFHFYCGLGCDLHIFWDGYLFQFHSVDFLARSLLLRVNLQYHSERRKQTVIIAGVSLCTGSYCWLQGTLQSADLEDSHLLHSTPFLPPFCASRSKKHLNLGCPLNASESARNKQSTEFCTEWREIWESGLLLASLQDFKLCSAINYSVGGRRTGNQVICKTWAQSSQSCLAANPKHLGGISWRSSNSPAISSEVCFCSHPQLMGLVHCHRRQGH